MRYKTKKKREDLTMDKKVTGILSYFGIILWLVAYLAGDKEGAKFHLNQSLALNLISIIWSTFAGVASGIFGKIPVIGIVFALVCVAVSIAFFVFWVMGLVSAIKEEDKPLPYIGAIQLLK